MAKILPQQFISSLNRLQSADGARGDAYYIPDFITKQEEEFLLRKIKESPQPKWKLLAKRRLQVWGGELTKPSNVLIPSPMPSFLIDYPDIIGRLERTGIFSKAKFPAPNQIIVNEYEPGQGIMPHEDGPSYYPAVATISLGGQTVFEYYQYGSSDDAPVEPGMSAPQPINPTPIVSLLLEPRSLVVTTEGLYRSCLHGIKELTADSFVAHGDGAQKVQRDQKDGEKGDNTPKGVKVANFHLIKDEMVRNLLIEGGTLERATRVSLTCRVIEKVASQRFHGGFLKTK